jgi:hypothetical protein
VNTIAATTSRVPRAALIGVVVLVAAFALLMVVRAGVFGGSSSTSSTAAPATAPTPTPAKPTTPAKPALVLLPGLPTQVAHALRYSKVVVVSLYTGSAQGDRAAVAAVHKGARAAGAGFVAVDVTNDRKAGVIASYAGPVSSPAMLVVKRPGQIVTTMQGTVDAAVVTQAAHNAGARRR